MPFLTIFYAQLLRVQGSGVREMTQKRRWDFQGSGIDAARLTLKLVAIDPKFKFQKAA